MEPTALSADWAALRIKGLSLGKVVREFFSCRGDIATLVDRFLYPRHGIGQISRFMQRDVESRGGKVHLGQEVVKVEHDGKRIIRIISVDSRGHKYSVTPEWVGL
jgi:RAB protein geranylgeranyltransferase component A